MRKSLAQLIATVARHEIPAGRWPELLQFIEEFTHSQDAQQREVSKYGKCNAPLQSTGPGMEQVVYECFKF